MPLLIGGRPALRKAGPRRADGIRLTRAEEDAARIYEQACAAFAQQTGPIGDSVRYALSTADVDGALLRLPWVQFQSVLGGMADPLGAAALAAGTKMPTTGMGTWRFNRTDPRTFEFARTQAANLVTYVTDEQRDALRGLITERIGQQVDVRDLGREIGQSIGLTPRMQTTVNNSWEKEFDRLKAEGVGTYDAGARAMKVADRVTQRLRAARGLTIARTEVSRAENAARYIGWAQAVESGQVSADSRKKWRTIPSGSMHGGPCDICAPMDKVVVRWDEPFPNGVEMPPAHPNCRCSSTMLPPDTPLTNPATPPGAASINVQPIPTEIAEPVSRARPLDLTTPTPPVPAHIVMDMAKLDPQAASMVQDQIGRLCDRFPEVAADMGYVGTMADESKWLVSQGGGPLPISRSAYAHAFNAVRYRRSGTLNTLGLSGSRWGRSPAAQMNLAQRLIQPPAANLGPPSARGLKGYAATLVDKHNDGLSRWSAIGSPRGTITHEFGHHVLYKIENAPGMMQQWQSLVGDRLRAEGLTADLKDFGDISNYAKASGHEAFAESFSSVMLSATPSRRAQIVVETADEILALIAKGATP